MFPMVTGFMNYGQQTIRAARYIGQSFIITLSHTNRLPVTIQYPYEKSIMSERFEVESTLNLINKQLLNYKYELSTYDRHELNYNQIALGRLPISIIGDYTIQTVRNSTPIQIDKENSFDSRTITNY
ncbi:hypothetical protein LUZ62_005777 [Rhynchospora pubera]|uniref:Uncharacterized protein n=1 Tax=Rhynchospora pubera TaxID=906938 RepID=A0AAV8BQ40_9POAL|nr:hypothetical protein LUZ62_005777 [Rhynchospora pubera]